MKQKQILYFVEQGWRGIRRCSLYTAKNGVFSNIIVKGRVEKDVLDIITKYNNVNISSASNNLFRICFVVSIIKNKLFGNLEYIIVNKEKSQKSAECLGRILGVKSFRLVEVENDSFKLLDINGEEVNKEVLIK